MWSRTTLLVGQLQSILIKKRSIILLQGIFKETFFDSFKKTEKERVFVLEGRPSFKAARVSCQELLKRGFSPTLIADNMAGFLFYRNWVNRIHLSFQIKDENGILCCVGGLIIAVLAYKHGVPIKLFPSEENLELVGKSEELFYLNGAKTVPPGIKAYVPLVEWVPNKYL